MHTEDISMDNFDSEKFIIINDQNTDLKIIDSNTKLIIFDLKKNTDNNLMITLGGLFPRSFTDNLKKYMKQDELDELVLTGEHYLGLMMVASLRQATNIPDVGQKPVPWH